MVGQRHLALPDQLLQESAKLITSADQSVSDVGEVDILALVQQLRLLMELSLERLNLIGVIALEAGRISTI